LALGACVHGLGSQDSIVWPLEAIVVGLIGVGDVNGSV
jgi:hypothetical protein